MRLLPLLAFLLALPSTQAQDITGPRIRAHTRFLASDLLEGRGVGVRGGEMASEYLATQLALLEAKPAGQSGTYFQPVPLVGVNPLPSAKLSAQLKNTNLTFRWLDDFVGLTYRQDETSKLDAEAIFVGHGITAPEYNWDDYKDVDVRGKVVVVFTAKALTYYGRWTYKYEEATRRGAAACIIIHTTPTASYGWDVVRTSWGREDMQVKLEPNAHALSFAGWVTQPNGDKLFASIGKTAAEMLALADTRQFRAIPLPIHFRGSFPAKIRHVESRNVAAIIPGSDPRKKDEAVVFSAHWDHLGVGAPVNGDSIHNGAVDNATGCAMVLEIARAWQALPQKPRRSAIFLFVTAEENGLRGSEYYGRHPFIPAGKTAANFNFDAFYPFGRTTDVVVTGAERTTLWPSVQNAAQRFRLTIKPDPHPEAGHFYRSDHFSMARVGIPSFSINMGTSFAGKPPDFGEKIFEEYNSKHYHQPSDEYQDTWDFAGMVDMAKFGFILGLDASNTEKLPTWRAGDEFLPAREKSFTVRP